MAKDPVCGMDVDEKSAQHKSDYQGLTYFFCAPGCKRAFEAEPAKYLALTFGNVVVVHEGVEHQIEYEEEDSEIFELYAQECAKHGAEVKMKRPARV